MSQKAVNIIALVVKIGLYLLPITALIVAGNFFANIFMPGVGDLFFPFITGKNFFFRIVVEILFALWIFAAVFDKKYRPKMSPIFWAMTATILVLILSTIFGANSYRSFWSNYERMEGLIGHLHLFVYFVILGSVFKSEIDWMRFFMSSLAVSAITSIYGYLQFSGLLEIHQSSDRLDATLGNSTYLAIFLIFNIFLAAYYYFKTDQVWLKWLMASVMVLEIPIVFLTATRGAILGLLGGAVFLAIIIFISDKSKLLRRTAFGIAGVVILVVGLFVALRNTSFVNNNYVLKRFADISFGEQTVKSRVTIWGMALEGFKERPLLGWGPENFNLVFNKYYKPELWPQEPWFDRSHNVVFDWLISGGILGLVSYLSIFGTALYVLWKKKINNVGSGFKSLLEPAIFTALFGAYFFHNFFVFDNLTSYFLFFSVLAFLHWRHVSNMTGANNVPVSGMIPKSKAPLGYVLSVISTAIIIFIIYFVNIKPLLASRNLLNTLKGMSVSSQNTDLILSDFDSILSLGTFGNMEAREQLSSYANNIVATNLPNDTKLKVINKAISEMEKQVQSDPEDTREFLFLSALYAREGRAQDALNAANKALEFSPKKQQVYFLIADLYISAGQNQQALDVLQKAYDLDPSYAEAAKNLALGAIINNDEAYAEKILQKAFGKIIIADQNLLTAYARVGNFKKVRDIWLLFIKNEPQNAQYHVNLAATDMRLNDRQGAIAELQKAIELNPDFKAQGQQFIDDIKAGKNP